MPIRRSISARAATTLIAALLAIVGAGVIVVAIGRHHSPPPEPSAAAAGRVAPVSIATSTTQPAATPHPTTSTAPRPAVPASPPAEITIPRLGVDSVLVRLDRNPDGTVQVPTSFHVAGWYEHSVSPGEIGPAVILGHVDSKSGPGIFYRIGLLVPGDKVTVKRLDGKVENFVITGVRQYPKTGFPTIDVYGNTSVPTIRLITCGGAFDQATGHYVSNIVAFGQLA